MNLHPEVIKDFEIKKTSMTTIGSTVDRTATSPAEVHAAGVKIHRTKIHDKTDKTVQHDQNFTGRQTDRSVVESNIEIQQSTKPFVLCEGDPLNVFKFPYPLPRSYLRCRRDPDVRDKGTNRSNHDSVREAGTHVRLT